MKGNSPVPAKKALLSRKNTPSSVTIRMYNVGFGDCFLLTFTYAKQERHVLIDYGSTAAPKNARAKYMVEIAQDLKVKCKGRLDILVETHRHRDHISGFTTEGEATGKIVASLQPHHIVQPWTEDPKAKPNAMTATTLTQKRGKPTEKELTSHFLGSLEDMHRVADHVDKITRSETMYAGPQTLNQLAFLGQNNLKNLSAVKNLISMGKKGQTHYVNAGMTLNALLPGVKITVLGPPTLKQTETIRTQRSKDPSEFWQFRSFWASQRLTVNAMASPSKPAPRRGVIRHLSGAYPPNMRWFIEQSRKAYADQTLEIVRDLDSVMNNTSVILLLEVGKRKLLFPGDAQIENWAYALKNKKWCDLLKDVNLYKVGHHGSLNATPKSLWKLFRNKGGNHTHDRLETLCSTKSGKHGSSKLGTEVPRAVLLRELKTNSDFSSTEEYEAPDTLSRAVTINVAG
jgi:beta-lactamase superfamily II metal-dependent hydrolase